jgi:SAM-dependent methyltransferase
MIRLRPAPATYDERFMDTMADAYLDRTPWTELRLAAVRDMADPQPGERILDLGCAAGAITHYLSTLGADTVGIDFEPLAIEKARALFPDLSFEVADATALPFADASFDKAVAADFVEHIDDSTFLAMCSELHRVLVPNGLFALYTPNPEHLIEVLKKHEFLLAQNPTHIGLRDRTALEALLRRGGFEPVRSEWRPSFYPGLRQLERVGGRSLSMLRYRLCMRALRVAPAEPRTTGES